MIQQFARSKTMIFAMALSILSVLQASMDVFTEYITPQSAGLIGVIISVIVAVLRVLTTAPLRDK